MINLSIKEISYAVDGEILCGNETDVINSVSTNSRQISNGALFVPIKGEKVDAHNFIEDAFSLGAIATLTQNKQVKDYTKTYIWVKDTKQALQDLAAYYRQKFNIPIIGITGSVGKTTTKEMVACALSYGGKTMKTSGNQNSQIGLPLTIFNLEKDDKFAVVEMGMSEFGEMEKISKVAKVNKAVITNIGISHIENLKTQENILNQKLHIIDHFSKDDTLFLNGDDPMLYKLKGNINVKTVFYGTKEFCDYRAENINSYKDSTEFTLVSPECRCNIKIPAIGRHNVLNSLVAIAIAEDLGLDIDKIIMGLQTFKQPNMRQQIHNTGTITVIDDTYNASPDSIKSGIDVLKTVQSGKRSIAVLGDMLELGDYSFAAHFSLGEYLVEKGVDILITVGNEAKAVIDGAKGKSTSINCASFDTNNEVIDYLKKVVKFSDTILIKGSRGMKMDEIVAYLLQNYALFSE